MKFTKVISWFLGLMMFVFGVLKVVVPTIRGWYSVQMTNSGLSKFFPFWLGISGEVVIGLSFILSLIGSERKKDKNFKIIIQLASLAVVFIMLSAVYVHLQPAVPANVLPLGIKAPYIPVFTLLLALTNIYLIRRVK